MSEFPPPGSDFEEEEEEHEDEAGADVQNHAQTHVHAVETQTQNPNTTSSMAPPLQNLHVLLSPQSRASGSWLWLLLSLPPPSSSSCCCLVLRWGLDSLDRTRRSSSDERRSQGVLWGQVGGSVVMSEEMKNVVLVPNVNAVFLLVAGGAEGGAWPRSFEEEGVIAQRA